jgi:hypothetical protein
MTDKPEWHNLDKYPAPDWARYRGITQNGHVHDFSEYPHVKDYGYLAFEVGAKTRKVGIFQKQDNWRQSRITIEKLKKMQAHQAVVNNVEAFNRLEDVLVIDGKESDLAGIDFSIGGSFVNIEPVGAKHDTGKPRFDLIPAKAEELLAKVLEFGAKKYSPDNWRLVDDAQSRYMAATLRHINAHRQGELLDKESGLPHLAHALASISFILELTTPSRTRTDMPQGEGF